MGRKKNKITVFNGSPRERRGNTQVIVEEILNGAQEFGAKTRTFFLEKYEFSACNCPNYYCIYEGNGMCVINDDFTKILLPELLDSDVVIVAFGIHVRMFPPKIVTFFGRMISLLEAGFERVGVMYVHNRRVEKFPKFFFLGTCGWPSETEFCVVKNIILDFKNAFGAEVIGSLFITQADVVSSLFREEFLEQKGPDLRLQGKYLATHTETTCMDIKQRLEKPFMKRDVFEQLIRNKIKNRSAKGGRHENDKIQ